MTTVARPPYARRSVPPQYDGGWVATEMGNVQRAIPSTLVRTVIASVTVTAVTAGLTDSTIFCDCTAGALTVNLPMASAVKGLVLSIKKIDAAAHSVTIAATVDGAASPTLATQYKSMTIISDGSTWYKLASV